MQAVARNFHGARPVHLTITMIKWIRTSRLSINKSLSAGGGPQLPWREAGPPNHHDSKVVSDQQAVKKKVSLWQAREGFEAKALQDDRLRGVDCRTLHSG